MEEDRPLFDKQDNTKRNGAVVTTAFRPRLLYSAIVSFLSPTYRLCGIDVVNIFANCLRDSLIDTPFSLHLYQ